MIWIVLGLLLISLLLVKGKPAAPDDPDEQEDLDEDTDKYN